MTLTFVTIMRVYMCVVQKMSQQFIIGSKHERFFMIYIVALIWTTCDL